MNQKSLPQKTIRKSDVNRIFKNIQFVPETTEIPFPQADSFERLIELFFLLLKEDLTKDEITEKCAFDSRQTGYYTAAGRYLELIEKDINLFQLTAEARTILAKNQKTKNLALIKKVLEHQVFYEAFKLTLDSGEIPSKKSIVEIMSQLNLDMSDSTKERRSSTVRGWISWIW
ncbi:MAG: translation elongation factor, partial [Okeania sp. SIO2H7]|nr:translation elongation factor [Okeania sp. SIO2H7]